MAATVLSILALAVLVALVVTAEARSRRRVRSIRAADVERIPYATFHSEEDGR